MFEICAIYRTSLKKNKTKWSKTKQKNLNTCSTWKSKWKSLDRGLWYNKTSSEYGNNCHINGYNWN